MTVHLVVGSCSFTGDMSLHRQSPTGPHAPALSNVYIVCVAGHTSHATDHPAVSAGCNSSWWDVSIATVLWYLAGQGSAEQVRIPGALPTGLAAGS